LWQGRVGLHQLRNVIEILIDAHRVHLARATPSVYPIAARECHDNGYGTRITGNG
jgi:hypothetical protein